MSTHLGTNEPLRRPQRSRRAPAPRDKTPTPPPAPPPRAARRRRQRAPTLEPPALPDEDLDGSRRAADLTAVQGRPRNVFDADSEPDIAPRNAAGSSAHSIGDDDDDGEFFPEPPPSSSSSPSPARGSPSYHSHGPVTDWGFYAIEPVYELHEIHLKKIVDFQPGMHILRFTVEFHDLHGAKGASTKVKFTSSQWNSGHFPVTFPTRLDGKTKGKSGGSTTTVDHASAPPSPPPPANRGRKTNRTTTAKDVWTFFDKQPDARHCLFCKQHHAANPNTDVPEPFGPNTSTGILRRHLYEHHLAAWVNGCDQLKITIKSEEALKVVNAYRAKQNSSTDNDPTADSEKPRPAFSKEAFVDAIVEWIVSDDQDFIANFPTVTAQLGDSSDGNLGRPSDNLQAEMAGGEPRTFGAAVARDPIATLRTSIRLIRASSLRRQYFSEVLKALQKKDLQLLRDVDTRWSSTLIMIDRAVLLREAIDQFLSETDSQELKKCKLSKKEWEALEAFQRILSRLSSETTPTLGHALPAFEAMISQWEKQQASHPETASIVQKGIDKLEDYRQRVEDVPAYTLSMLVSPALKLAWYEKYKPAKTQWAKQLYLREIHVDEFGVTQSGGNGSNLPQQPFRIQSQSQAVIDGERDGAQRPLAMLRDAERTEHEADM
ncbi:hypothetical protein R3P38DRAFT_2768385 [Favolaschia claudopus]|uniref:BED-type domain-containing protein n=1 Tax=Favolaschia claudopus TaxID=2862362 RepID=A0AAW0CRM5_9AGAR